MVQNHLGAAGLPVEARASAAHERLDRDPTVICAEISASRDEDGVDGVQTADLAVDVTVASGAKASRRRR
jgi:hypothetical protein